MTAAARHRRLPGLLLARFGGRWEIRHPRSDVWTAERREGTAVRFVVAPDAAGLAAKLEAIEQEERP